MLGSWPDTLAYLNWAFEIERSVARLTSSPPPLLLHLLQVDVFLCRDLDSRISPREVAAVREWVGAGAAVHSMRDHPAHNTPLLGAAWGALLAPANLRHKWARAWTKMEADPVLWSRRDTKGPDQELLARCQEHLIIIIIIAIAIADTYGRGPGTWPHSTTRTPAASTRAPGMV